MSTKLGEDHVVRVVAVAVGDSAVVRVAGRETEAELGVVTAASLRPI